ncbi:hypothetical protein ACIRYZ_41430 [Kitasatospora sp. NPDC101155]|uniref:hypothetical protein n=1 Tax=Kitasatospora sp. NPDC101155 TaxID=3364097 RepID=UPI0038158F60
MENGSQRPSRRRKAAILLTGLALSATVVLGAVALGRAVEGEPYPVADPAATAEHLNGRVLAAYDALSLPEAPVLNPELSLGVKADVYRCHGRGLGSFLDNLSDSPPSEPRTAAIGAGFTVTGLTHPQAVEAALRARRTLTGQGWKVVSYEEFDGLRLNLKPPNVGPGSVSGTVLVAYHDGSGFLEVSAFAECVRYPSDTPVDFEGKPEHLPALALPAQIRRP